jgi:hypothetical protein
MSVALVISVLNFIFCLWRAITSLQANRLATVVWALLSYFSFFFVFVVAEGAFAHKRGFTGETVSVSAQTIQFAAYFIAAFNVTYAAAEMAVWKLIGVSAEQVSWHIEERSGGLTAIEVVLATFLVFGGALYWSTMQDLGYRDYVEFKGSNWAMVFLWASTPLIALGVMQRRYWVAALACVPFVVFTLHLHVRSFALLSVVPAVVLFYFDYVVRANTGGRRILLPLAVGLASLGVLLGLSAVVMQGKVGEVNLPDADMTRGTALIMEAMKDGGRHSGFDSLAGYGLNFINPFLKLADVQRPELVETPVYMAQLIEGVPKNWPVYFHFPTLWYADAYVSFGVAGIGVALLWAMILTTWEAVALRFPVLMALTFPYFVWHAYMLLRGSTTIASVPFSYAFYISLLVFLVFGGRQLWRRGGRASRQQDQASDDQNARSCRLDAQSATAGRSTGMCRLGLHRSK